MVCYTTSSHIANTRNAFVAFKSLVKQINGVGNAITYAQGQGTIDIHTQINDKHYVLTLSTEICTLSLFLMMVPTV